MLALFLLGIASFANAQTISTASGSNYLGNLSINNTSPLNVSFVIQNTTGSAVALTDVSCHMAPFGSISFAGDPSVTKLFVSSTSLSGTYDYSTAAWAQIATGNATVPATLSFVPVITGINYIIPAGAQLRFVLELSKGLRISSNLIGDPMPTPNVFSSGGINLQLGDFQIAGQNIGYGGVAPTAPAGNTPVFFGGSVTLSSTVPCTGTPNPGNTMPASSNVCSGSNFTLTLQNATAGSGVTYQWQSASASTGPWTNISGATNASYTAVMSATTYYRCNVTCSGNTGTSTFAVVNLNPPTACYCIPPNSDCSDDDVITRVKISTLDNPSTCSASGYTYFNSVAAPVVYSGASNPITIEAPTTYSESVGVWIDYNQNGQFEATEFTSIGTKASGQGSITGNVPIPSTALTGTTRMRVRLRFGSTLFTGAQACAAYTFGETEDYDVNIQPCVPVTITTHPSSASITCGNNTSFTVATSGSLPVYSWEWRPNSSSAWFTVANGGIYSGATTTTLTLTNVSAAYSGYQYRAVVVGGCSATDVSQTATLTVNPLVPVVTPASATICSGAVQQLTLTNTLSNTVTLTEGFNTVLPSGWAQQNNSSPLGTTNWFQGNPASFPSNSGAPDSYIAANYQNTSASASGTISNWLLSPVLSIKNGDFITFYSRIPDGQEWADRLELRISSNGSSTNVGTTATSVGDFTNLLLTINPSLSTGVYPKVWTQFTATVSGLSAPNRSCCVQVLGNRWRWWF